MSEPTLQKPRPYFHTEAERRWPNAKIAQFLRALAATGSVARAARSVEMTARSAHDLRGRLSRDHGPAFGRLWDEAVAIAVSRLCAKAILKMRAEAAAKATPRKVTPGYTS